MRLQARNRLIAKMARDLVRISVVGIFLPMVMSRMVNIEWDPKGYILYCPCSGRFTGQTEQFLGSLEFAKRLNRVLVIPPYIDYPCGRKHKSAAGGLTLMKHQEGRFGNQVNTFLSTLWFTKEIGRALVIPPFIKYSHMQSTAGQSEYIPFDSYFDLEKIKEYYPDVITMGDFIDHLAPSHWPPSERAAYCSRKLADINEGRCPRTGNPHGTFWEAMNIDFAKSEIWEDQMHYNVDYEPWRKLWEDTYPPDTHPVIALMNAPAFSPIQPHVEELHQYLQWLPDIVEEAEAFIEENVERPFMGIHLRNGADWTRTCDLADGSHPRLMSSHQCMGHYSQEGVVKEVCIQSEEQVIQELEVLVDKHKPKTIFIATDHVSMEDEIQDAFPDLKVVTMAPERPQVDLYILEQSDHFVGNCVSAFSAFVSRVRVLEKKSSSYLGYVPKHLRDEL